jgi:nicotinamidase/pyrazinamidase
MKLAKNGIIASFDIDAQKGFTPLCPDELPVPGGDEIVDELNRQATFADLRIGSKDAHSPTAIWVAGPDGPMLSPVQGANVDVRWNPHCIPGTRGFELLDGLPAPAEYDFFVWKGVEPDMHPYGACYHDLAETRSTGVIEFLRQKGVTTVLVGGLALDYCVKTTTLQLCRAGFDVVVNLAACRGIAAESIAAALDVLARTAGIRIIDSTADLAGI